MNKIIKILGLLLCVFLFSFPAFSEAVSNHELTERVTRLEAQQEKGILPAKWAERITLSGAIEDDPEFNRYDVVPGSLAGLGLGPTYKGEKPAVWNAELGYTFEVAGKETIVGAAYQGSDNGEDVFPENRFLGVVGMVIFNDTVVSLEVLHDEFENDDERDLITAQLAIGF